MDSIRVVLVDDQVLFIESLKIVLEVSTQDIEIVGIARNGREALELLEGCVPDLVLMDVRMGDSDGVRAAAEIRRRHPGQKVIMLTTFDDDEYVLEALRGGASGYLLKDIPPNELIAAVRAAHQGAMMISPSVARKLVGRELLRPSAAPGEPEWLRDLSAREKQLLKLLAQGWSNRIIAERLAIAEQTVKNYLSVVYDKLSVKDRNGALMKIEGAGLDSDAL